MKEIRPHLEGIATRNGTYSVFKDHIEGNQTSFRRDCDLALLFAIISTISVKEIRPHLEGIATYRSANQCFALPFRKEIRPHLEGIATRLHHSLLLKKFN